MAQETVVGALPLRLYWHDGRGIARCDGVEVQLRQAPRVPGISFAEIDCAPGLCTQLREQPIAQMREMEGWEVAFARRWLEHLAAAARDALNGEVALAVVQR